MTDSPGRALVVHKPPRCGLTPRTSKSMRLGAGGAGTATKSGVGDGVRERMCVKLVSKGSFGIDNPCDELFEASAWVGPGTSGLKGSIWWVRLIT